MVIYVFISEEVVCEVRELMLVFKNILGLKDGEFIINFV